MKIAVYLFFCLISEPISANEFSAIVQSVSIYPTANHYELNTDIKYKLSSTVKEALQKGISLTWAVKINLKKESVLWDSTLKQIELSYQIQNHALLNLYSVKNLINGQKEMFSTLAGPLHFNSQIRGLTLIDKRLIEAGQHYFVTIKVNFKHEDLPVPIRPFSYFDSQWAFSSPWKIWPLPK